MALIRAKRGLVPDGGVGLVGMKFKGDKFHFLHAQDVAPVMDHCRESRKDPNKGWTKKRTMQRIASIPELVFYNHPEFIGDHGRLNLKELRKFLHSPEGEAYVTAAGSI